MGNTLSKEDSIKKSHEMFSSLSNEEINKILSQYKYNLYDAIPELSKENEKKEEENKKLINEKKEKGNQDYIDEIVKEFKELDKGEIEKKLSENKHDPKATLKQIVKSMSKKNNGNDEERFVSAIQERYTNLSKEEILKEVKNTNNREEAVGKLIELSHNKIFQNLKMAHNNLDDKIIFGCCEKANWVFNEALNLCEKCKTVDPKEVLEIQAGTIDYLSKDMEENLKNNKIDPIVMEVQAGTIEYIAQDMEKNIHQLSQLKAKQFIIEDEENKQLEEQKRMELATDKMQPLLHQIIEPTTVEKSDTDSLEYKIVNNEIEVKVSLIDATNNSWIGFFKKGEPNNHYLSYNWLSYLKDKTFHCEVPKVNGEYEFRVFKDKTTLAFSKIYSVHGEDSLSLVLEDTTVTVNWNIFSFDVVTESAWLSIHSVGEERSNQYRRFSWMKNNSGSVSFKRMIHDGTYEARIYFKNYFSSTLKIKSNEIEIKN